MGILIKEFMRGIHKIYYFLLLGRNLKFEERVKFNSKHTY